MDTLAINTVILEELRALRSDYNDNARDAGERLATLENSTKGLVGNGQPGRITILEETVKHLQEWRWWLMGVGAASGAVVSLAGCFLHR